MDGEDVKKGAKADGRLFDQVVVVAALRGDGL